MADEISGFLEQFSFSCYTSVHVNISVLLADLAESIGLCAWFTGDLNGPWLFVRGLADSSKWYQWNWLEREREREREREKRGVEENIGGRYKYKLVLCIISLLMKVAINSRDYGETYTERERERERGGVCVRVIEREKETEVGHWREHWWSLYV